MILNQLIIEVKKNTFNLTFLICVFTSFVLFLCSDAYYDIRYDRTYSVIECIFNYDKSLIENDYSFASILLFSNGLNNQYFKIFLPVLSSLPCLMSCEAVLQSQFVRYEYYRSSKNKTIFSKFIAASLTGGIISLFSIITYGVVVFSLFPKISFYNLGENIPLIENTFLSSFKMIIGFTIYGMISAILPFTLFEILRNVSITESITFILFYIYYMILNKLTLINENPQKIAYLYPHSIASIFNNKFDLKIIIFNFIFVFIILYVYYIFKIRRRDVSE